MNLALSGLAVLAIFGTGSLVVLIKAEESLGLLDGFGECLTGRPHGILVSAEIVASAPSKALRGMLAMRTLLVCAVAALCCHTTAIIVTGDAWSANLLTQNTVGLWCIIAVALHSRKVLGMFRSAMCALLGSTLLNVFAVVPFAIFMAATQQTLSIDELNNLFFLGSVIGMSIGVYFTPAQCIVRRTFENGHTDLACISVYSSAYRKIEPLATYTKGRSAA